MKQWPHAPVHLPTGPGNYFVTAGTYKKLHHFRRRDALDMLEEALLRLAHEHGWDLAAWAVFSNHYHWIGSSPDGASALKAFEQHLHSETARWVNKLDAQPGRKVWHQYRDTELTFEKSRLARLNYVMSNPSKHGLVENSAAYPWCSAAWFERTAAAAYLKTVRSFRTDQLNISDEYAVLAPD